MAKIIHSTCTLDGVAALTQTSKPGTGRSSK